MPSTRPTCSRKRGNAEKLGITHIGQEIEIRSHRAHVTGLASGIRTFTQAPYVFTSYNTALELSDLLDGEASYILIRLAPRADAFWVTCLPLSPRVGAKTIQTGAPTEKRDASMLDIIVALDPSISLPIGLRVDCYVVGRRTEP